LRYLTHDDIIEAAEKVALQILEKYKLNKDYHIYPIPRGGVPAVYILIKFLPSNFKITSELKFADIIFDDLIDSGNTISKHRLKNPTAEIYTLYPKPSEWLVFPWEHSAESSIDDAFTRLQQFYNVSDTKLKLIKPKLIELLNS